MKKVLLLLFSFWVIAGSAFGQISVTSGLLNTAITEDFTATANQSTFAMPGGWKTQQSNASPTWSGAATTQFSTSSPRIRSNTGSPTSGSMYVWFLSTSSTDGAIGAMTSGSFASPNNIIVAYTNNSGSTITSWDGTFDIERYRRNTAAASISIFESTDGTNWSSALATFNATSDAAVFATGTDLQGRPQASVTGKTFSSSTSISDGSTIYFNIRINTTGSSSQGIAIDNWSITPSATPPATLTFGTNPLTVPTTVAGTAGSTSITTVSKSGTSGNFTYGSIPSSVLMQYSTNGGASWNTMNNAGASDLPQAVDQIRASFRPTATASLSATNVAFSEGGLSGTVNLSISGTVQGRIVFSPTSVTVPTTTAGTAGSYAQSTPTITAATGNITIGGIPSSVDMQYSTNAGSSWTNVSNGGTIPNTTNRVQYRFNTTATAGTLSPTNVTFSGGGLSTTYNLSISGTVNAPSGPGLPTGVSSTVVCRSGTSTISFTKGSGATVTRLFANPSGGSELSSTAGTTLTTPTISTGTTYYLESFDGVEPSSSRQAVTITVNPGLTSGLTASASNGVAFSYTPTSSGSPTFSWTRGTLPSGVTVTSGSASGTGTINQTFTNNTGVNQTVNFSITTTSGTCNGDVQTLVVTVSGVPAVPTGASATAVCNSGTSTITFTKGAGAVDTRLFANPSGGSSLATTSGTSLTSPSISAGTTYYLESFSAGTPSTSRTAVSVTVNNPTLSSSTSPSAPNASSFTYTPTSTSGSPTFSWSRGALPSGVTSSNSATSGTGAYTTTFTNTNTGAQTVTLTYTVTSGGCEGAPVDVVISIEGGTIFFSRTGATDFNAAASWAPNADGTGTSPASINNDYTLIVRTGASMTTSAARTLKGITVQEGATLTMSHAITVTGSGSSLNVQGKLVHNNTLSLNTTQQYQGASTVTFGDNSTWEFLQYPSTITWKSSITSVGNVHWLGAGPGTQLNLLMPSNVAINGDWIVNLTGSNGITMSNNTSTYTFKKSLQIVDGVFQFGNDSEDLFTINIEGDLIVGSAGVFRPNVGTAVGSVINFTGTQDAVLRTSTLPNDGTDDIINVVIASGKKVTMEANFRNRGNFTVNGTLDMGTFELSNASGTNTFTIANGGKVITAHANGLKNSGNTAAVREDLAINAGATIRYNRNGNQSTGLSTLTADFPVESIEIASTDGGIVTLDNDLTVNGDVLVETGSIFALPDGENIKCGSGGTVTIDGTVRVLDADGFAGGTGSGCSFTSYPSAGSITLGPTSTVIYAGSTQVVTSFTDYVNLSVNTAGTKSLNGNILVDGVLSVTAGTLAVGNQTLEVLGALEGGGTLTSDAAGTIIISGTSAKATWPWAMTLAGNLTITRPAGLELGANLTTQGTLTLNGGNLEINGQTLTVEGNIAGASNLVGSSTSQLVITGTSSNTMSAFGRPALLQALTVNPTSSRTFEVNPASTVTTTLTIGASGTLSVPASGTTTFEGTSFTVTSGGQLTGGTGSKFVVGGTASSLTWPSTLTDLGNLDLELNRSAGVAIASAANLTADEIILTSGNLTINGGTLTINNGLHGTSGQFVSLGNSKLVMEAGTSTYGIGFASGTLNQLTVNGGSHATSTNIGITGTSNGIFINDGTLDVGTNTLGGTSSNLTMTGGTLKLGQLGVTLPENYVTSTLTGGTIELSGFGAQTLRGSRTYVNVAFSGSGTKALSSNITGTNKVTGTVTINGASTVLDVANFAAFGSYDDATATNLTINDGEFRSSNTSTAIPNATGTYTMTGTGKITLYGTSSSTNQTLRGGRTYRNIDITATAANTNSSGNVVQGSGTVTIEGTMNVLSPAIYATSNPVAGIGNFVVQTGAGLFFNDANGITPASAGTGVSAGSIRTTSRTFNSGSTYGVRGTGNQVTGTGLPSTLTSFYNHKTANSVTFTNATTISNTLILLGDGGITAGSNLTLASNCTILRTGGTLSSAPSFAGNVNLQYNQHSSAITMGAEVPAASNVLSNLFIANSNGVIAASNFTVNGNIVFISGNLTTGSNIVTLSSAAVITGETNDKRLVGTAQMTRNVGMGSSSFGGLGYEILAGGENLGSVTAIRRTGSGTALTGNGNSSINTVFDVTITGTQPSSGRRINFTWLGADDNGKDFTAKRATVFRRESPASPWMRLRLGDAWNPVQITGDRRKVFSLTYHFSEYTVTDEDGPLPVVLTSFTGKAVEKGASLVWSTSQEVNNAGFVLERSLDGEVFDSITFVAGKGTTATASRYGYLDTQFSGKAFYRLVQRDLDGTREVFQTILVKADGNNTTGKGSLTIYPNPANDLIQLNLVADQVVDRTEVVDATGRVVNTNTGMPAAMTVKDFAPGMYTVRCTLADGAVVQQRLVVR